MTDTFVKVYTQLHEDNSKLIVELKEAFEKVEMLLNLVNNREMSIAKTNLEQTSMWATKALVRADQANGSQPIRPAG